MQVRFDAVNYSLGAVIEFRVSFHMLSPPEGVTAGVVPLTRLRVVAALAKLPPVNPDAAAVLADQRQAERLNGLSPRPHPGRKVLRRG